jgi:hypothetical protein
VTLKDGCYTSDSSAEVARLILYAVSGEEGPLNPLCLPSESLTTAGFDYLGGSPLPRRGATFRAKAPGGPGILGAFNGLITFRCGFPGLVAMKDHKPCCAAALVVAMKTSGAPNRRRACPAAHACSSLNAHPHALAGRCACCSHRGVQRLTPQRRLPPERAAAQHSAAHLSCA